MPQLNPDDAANDEPKTYNDEAIGGEYNTGNELNDIKGDLVDEVDGDAIQRSYEVIYLASATTEGYVIVLLYFQFSKLTDLAISQKINTN